MRFELITLFPGAFQGFLRVSLISKARERKLLSVHLHDPRRFGQGAHAQVDERPYGGGPGMVLMAEPIYQTLRLIKRQCPIKGPNIRLILSARGERLTAQRAKHLATKCQITLLCGHYEGVDERIRGYFDQEVSIGDFITMGGEVPAMAIIEAVSRFIPGVLGEPQSAQEESFLLKEKGRPLLEWPAFTRPEHWRGQSVPKILLQGHHGKIALWRRDQALALTQERRQDLLK